MKKMFILLLIFVLVLTLSGCDLLFREKKTLATKKEPISAVESNVSRPMLESKIENAFTDSVEYNFRTEDRSYKNSQGQKLVDHYYKTLFIVGESESISNINKALRDDMDNFFLGQTELAENSMGASAEYPYYYTCDSEVTHNKDGFFSVKFTTNWYMGGVSNTDHYGLTFNLNTGSPATLTELTGKNSKALEESLKDIVWEYLNKELYEDMFADIASETLKEYKLDKFDFYLNNGEIVLTFPTYTFASGAAGATVVNTGIYITK